MKNFLAQTDKNYSCGTYGSGGFGECADPASFIDLGYDWLLPIILAISLVIATAILLVRRALRKRARGSWTLGLNRALAEQ